MISNVALSLAEARLAQADECLRSAERELKANSYKSSANRSYYCIFHAIRAVLALDSFDSKKHSGVISAFRQRYIKTGVFPAEFSDIIRDAFDVRNSSDYDDFFIVAKEDVVVQLNNASTLLKAAKDYIYDSASKIR